MAKPIFIIKAPFNLGLAQIADVRDKLKQEMSDYHILVIAVQSEEISFECYNSEKSNEIDFELLQRRVLQLAEMNKKYE